MGVQMKVEDILTLDLNDKVNIKKLVKFYLKIGYVNKTIGNIDKIHQMDIYDDLGDIYVIALHVLNKMKFNNHPSMFIINGQITSNLKDEVTGDFYTVYAKTIKEYFIKLTVFCYYFRNKSKKNK